MQIDYPTDRRGNPGELSYRLPTAPDLALPAVVSIPRILTDFGRRWIGPMAIALILFEMVIRTLIYNPRPQVSDPLLGQIPAPGSTWVNGREGFGRIHWNRQGIRGRDFPGAAARNVHRVVVVGDSFPLGEGVNDDQTFCARLENDLSRRLNQNVWIGNCGRAKLDAADFLCSLPAYDQKFHPELTVLTLNLSDFRVHDHMIVGLAAQFNPAAQSGDGLVIQSLSGSTEHQPMKRGIPEPLQRAGHAFLDHSALVLYGGARFYNAALKKVPGDANVRHVEQIATVAQMERYFAVLIARSHTPIVCAYISPWNRQWEVNNYFNQVSEQRLSEAAARLNIPFIATDATFRRHVTRTGQPANGFYNTNEGPGLGHLTPVGHRIVAAALAPRIAPLLADPSRRRLLRVAQLRARAGKGAL